MTIHDRPPGVPRRIDSSAKTQVTGPTAILAEGVTMYYFLAAFGLLGLLYNFATTFDFIVGSAMRSGVSGVIIAVAVVFAIAVSQSEYFVLIFRRLLILETSRETKDRDTIIIILVALVISFGGLGYDLLTSVWPVEPAFGTPVSIAFSAFCIPLQFLFPKAAYVVFKHIRGKGETI